MKKTQIGWVFIVVLLLINILTLYKAPSPVIFIFCVTFIILLLFYKLTIHVDDKAVSFSFGIGMIRGKYSLKDIEACRSITYLPLGFGIRIRPNTILFNVSGRHAIELSIKGKKRKVWIGTNTPEELAAYINSKLG